MLADDAGQLIDNLEHGGFAGLLKQGRINHSSAAEHISSQITFFSEAHSALHNRLHGS